jgi:uncharacterized protein
VRGEKLCREPHSAFGGSRCANATVGGARLIPRLRGSLFCKERMHAVLWRARRFAGISAPMIEDWHFYLAAIPAVLLMGLSKGGFSGLAILSTPLVAMVTSPVRAAAIMLPILIVQDMVSVWAYRKEWSARNLVILLPGAVVGIGAGYLLARHVSDAAVTLAVGVVSAGFVLWQWLKHARAGGLAAEPADVPKGLFWGTVSGFTSFISHTGGPPYQVYTLPQRMPPAEYAGTTTLFFTIVNLIKVVPYFLLGQFAAQNLAVSASLLPVAIAATFAGVWLVRRVPAEQFFLAIYVITLVVGLKLIWDGAAGLR